jgi:hypothetical protein
VCVWDINYCPVNFWPELSSCSRECLLQVLFVSLSQTFIFADLTFPKACVLHISFRFVPSQDIHIRSLGYAYWQFIMSLTVALVVDYPLLFWEYVLYRVAMFYPSLLLTLVLHVTGKDQVCVWETSTFALFTSNPKGYLLHLSFRCVPLQDIHICSLGYVYWQFFMSLTVTLAVRYPLLFLEDILDRMAIFSPSLLLTLA